MAAVEILTYTVFKRPRLAYINDLAAVVFHNINAGAFRQKGGFLLQIFKCFSALHRLSPLVLISFRYCSRRV